MLPENVDVIALNELFNLTFFKRNNKKSSIKN